MCLHENFEGVFKDFEKFGGIWYYFRLVLNLDLLIFFFFLENIRLNVKKYENDVNIDFFLIYKMFQNYNTKNTIKMVVLKYYCDIFLV